jgi:hypothetical protein
MKLTKWVLPILVVAGVGLSPGLAFAHGKVSPSWYPTKTASPSPTPSKSYHPKPTKTPSPCPTPTHKKPTPSHSPTHTPAPTTTPTTVTPSYSPPRYTTPAGPVVVPSLKVTPSPTPTLTPSPTPVVSSPAPAPTLPMTGASHTVAIFVLALIAVVAGVGLLYMSWFLTKRQRGDFDGSTHSS